MTLAEILNPTEQAIWDAYGAAGRVVTEVSDAHEAVCLDPNHDDNTDSTWHEIQRAATRTHDLLRAALNERDIDSNLGTHYPPYNID